VILDQLENGNVVVVGHSYGTIVATAAVARLGRDERKANGNSTNVQHIVFLSGILVPRNTTMLALMGSKVAPQYLIEGNTILPFGPPGATHVLYNDIHDPTEVEKAIWKLKPQSYTVNTSPTPDQITSLRGIPLSYLMCNNGNAVDFETRQKPFVEGFRSAGIEIYGEVANSGHSPFLKFPGRTAKFVRKAWNYRIRRISIPILRFGWMLVDFKRISRSY
jgi:hypothetical protein